MLGVQVAQRKQVLAKEEKLFKAQIETAVQFKEPIADPGWARQHTKEEQKRAQERKARLAEQPTYTAPALSQVTASAEIRQAFGVKKKPLSKKGLAAVTIQVGH